MANIRPKIRKLCETCGKEFFVYPYRKDAARFCRHYCYAKTVHLQKKTDKWYEAMKKRIIRENGWYIRKEKK